MEAGYPEGEGTGEQIITTSHELAVGRCMLSTVVTGLWKHHHDRALGLETEKV